jgi:hypothetical protein
MAAMPQVELLAWADALLFLKGGKDAHVSDAPPVDDPRSLELPQAVREALK